MESQVDLAIIGGCGRVGLPLGIVFADAGLRVALYDVNATAVESVRARTLPFDEEGGQAMLERAVDAGRLTATTDPAVLREAEHVVVVVGTPIDEHLTPDPAAVTRALAALTDNLRDGQLLVLRSTVYPGVTEAVERMMRSAGLELDVAFCPERIAEGRAISELRTLPQLISATSEHGLKRAEQLFSRLGVDTVALSPAEAELAKLFTNAWRYIKFAAANQLFTLANDAGLDYERIRSALAYNYPRAADMPGAGFAAGPCLLKDTMQLAALHNNNFVLGHASMMVNEGLPLYLVARMGELWDLADKQVGILGMAFKAESDDNRASLAYKLKRVLRFKAAGVLTTDPFVRDDPDLRPLDEVLARADILVIGAPHSTYRDLAPSQPVVDVWNVLGRGVRI